MGNENEIELKKPLSTWEKIKTGVVSFVGSAMNYIPRGIMMSALVVGISTLVASMGGPNLMGTWDSIGGLGGFLQRTAMVVGIGATINGGLGAYKGIKAHSALRNKEIELQRDYIKKQRSLERTRQRDHTAETSELADDVVAQHGIPASVGKDIGIV